VLSLAESLKRSSNGSVPIGFSPRRAGEQQRSCIKNDKARRILGWHPKVELDAGLAKTYAWFKQTG
jgi:nucleoside-diphosphate-sugar epimerase